MNASRAAIFFVLLVSLSLASTRAQPQNSATEVLDKLADDFWTWRAKYAPFTGDDVNRIERPSGTRAWLRVNIDTR